MTFTPLERHLAGLGLTFQEEIKILGVDPPGGFTGTELPIAFTDLSLPVTDGGTLLSIPRNKSRTVNRSVLQEDTGLGDSDEIRAIVRVKAIGLPPGVTPGAFSDQEVLIG